MGFVVQPGAADVHRRGMVEQFFLDGVAVEAGHRAQPARHRGPGPADGLQRPAEGFDVGPAGVEEPQAVRGAPDGELAQVQAVGLAGLAAISGQEPAERQAFGVGEDGRDRHRGVRDGFGDADVAPPGSGRDLASRSSHAPATIRATDATTPSYHPPRSPAEGRTSGSDGRDERRRDRFLSSRSPSSMTGLLEPTGGSGRDCPTGSSPRVRQREILDGLRPGGRPEPRRRKLGNQNAWSHDDTRPRVSGVEFAGSPLGERVGGANRDYGLRRPGNTCTGQPRRAVDDCDRGASCRPCETHADRSTRTGADDDEADPVGRLCRVVGWSSSSYPNGDTARN